MSNENQKVESHAEFTKRYKEATKIDAVEWLITIWVLLETVIIYCTLVYHIDFIVNYVFSFVYIIVALIFVVALFKEQKTLLRRLDEEHKAEK